MNRLWYVLIGIIIGAVIHWWVEMQVRPFIISMVDE